MREFEVAMIASCGLSLAMIAPLAAAQVPEPLPGPARVAPAEPATTTTAIAEAPAAARDEPSAAPSQPRGDPPGAAAQARAIAEAMAQLPAAPPLETVQAAALAQARIDPRAANRWVLRARASAALPSFSAGYDRRVDNSWALDQEAGTADDLATDVGSVHTLRFRATWELDRLIFNPDELRASRAQLDLLDWRAELLVQVTQLYYEHRRLCLERSLAAGTDLTKSIARELRILEIEGFLGALTRVPWR